MCLGENNKASATRCSGLTIAVEHNILNDAVCRPGVSARQRARPCTVPPPHHLTGVKKKRSATTPYIGMLSLVPIAT